MQERQSSINSPQATVSESRLPVVDLTQANGAAHTSIYPFEIELQTELSRALYRSGRHLLLVGDRGVGKTTALYDFAAKVREGQFAHLRRHSVLRVDCRAIPTADAPLFLHGMLQNIRANPAAVWCLDGIGHLFRTTGGRDLKAEWLMLLNQPDAKIIGVLNREEYAEQISQDADLLAHFQRIDVTEPNENVAQDILSVVANDFETDFELQIAADVLDRTIALTSNFMLSERHPRKSIRVLKQVCEDLHFDRTQLGIPTTRVIVDDIDRIVAKETGIPVETISGKSGTNNFEKTLQEAVVGQDDVLTEIDRELRIIRSGMSDPGKPASVMLFAGMTGVGKTELAKRIAEIYSSSRRLHTYTMANFTEPHSVSGIIGVPPGYVGFENGGRLINELNADPYSVFLLDEAEKAHPNVWKPFLNLFDEGWIVDQRGVKAYADRAIFILTTNAGDRNIAQMTKSEKPHEEIVDFVKQALAKVRHERASQPVFPPAFLARIGRVVVFKPLEESAMIGIATKACQRLKNSWKEKRGIRIDIDQDVIEAIGKEGHRLNEQANGREGGRIIQKLVKDHIGIKVQESLSTSELPLQTVPSVQVSLNTLDDSERAENFDVTVTLNSSEVVLTD